MNTNSTGHAQRTNHHNPPSSSCFWWGESKLQESELLSGRNKISCY